MSDVDADVVIVGAGIAGLALAGVLAKAGMHAAVVEATSRPVLPPLNEDLDGWDRRVSALTPSSEALLQSLGVWPLMRAQRVGPYDHMQVWDAEGTGEIDFSAASTGVPVLGHIVENRVTVDALIARAEAASGMTLVWEDPLDGIDLGPEQICVTTASGRRLSAPLLVGADGARSKVRDQLGFRTRAWSYEQRALVATIALDTPHGNTCYQAFLQSGPLALLPLADERLCSIVWSADDPVADRLASLETPAFVAALNRALDGRAPTVVDCSARGVFPLRQCHAVDYIQPRVALIADAAHSIHPLAGQGINLGLRDVKVLGEELTRAWGLDLDHGDPAVLRRYQRQRMGDNLAMMAAMEGFKRGFGSPNPLVRVARNLGLSWVDGFRPLKHWLAAHALA